jgi:hypothetical protein
MECRPNIGSRILYINACKILKFRIICANFIDSSFTKVPSNVIARLPKYMHFSCFVY